METPAPSIPQKKPTLVLGTALALGLAVASWYLAMLPKLNMLGPLTIALIVGIAYRAAAGVPESAVPGTKFSARSLLRLGIILMGARLDFRLVAQAGPRILALDALVIVAGILGIGWIANRFGVPRKLGLLMAVGNSICGASAVAAAAPVTAAEEDDVTLAVALCGILGTVGVLFYVLLGRYIGLSTDQLAVMSGSTLHEVAQVMAAAFTWGTHTGELGTLVKLTRVVLLAPTIVVLGLVSGSAAGVKYSWKEPPVPWFVLGFLALGGIASTGLLPAVAKTWLSNTSVFLMVMAMAAMGLNTHLGMIRKSGMRVIYAGVTGFAMLALLSYAVIRVLNIS